MSLKFQRRKEDFTCLNCGLKISGNGYTNHCPKCFFSRHVDNFPGDRKVQCLGLMEPVDIIFQAGRYSLVQRCRNCGKKSKNKVLNNDNFQELLKIVRKGSK